MLDVVCLRRPVGGVVHGHAPVEKHLLQTGRGHQHERPGPSLQNLEAVWYFARTEHEVARSGGELLVPKRKSARADGHASMATCAVVRRPGRGRLAVVGLGPGARDLLTPRATAELRRASVLVGLDQYVDQIRDLLSFLKTLE